MTRRIAVAVLHGMGNQPPTFADRFREGLGRRFVRHGGAADALVVRPVHWAEVLSHEETRLLEDEHGAARLDWRKARAFAMHFLADVVAYQIVPKERAVYDAVHGHVATTLRALAEEAGDDAPLCVVAHSLGSVIASNYLYDLQKHEREPESGILPDTVARRRDRTPLERGRTLAWFFTLGSPLALFSLRWENRGRPIQVPAPDLAAHHPGLEGRWENLYDRDDVIAWPLRPLNEAYRAQVREDRAVNVGPFPWHLTPLAHTRYLDDATVQDRIAATLAEASRSA